jgi:hypothetical protein
MDLALSNSFCCRVVGRNRPWDWGRHHCSCHDSNNSRDPLVELDSSRRVARTNHRRAPFSWLLASGRCPHDWNDYRDRSHGCIFRNTPSNHHARAMALLRGHGDCLWVDPSQIGVYHGIDSDARDIQCDSVLVPVFVDCRSGRALVQMSPRFASFATTRSL